MKSVNVGLLGLGTVGGGTLNVLMRNATEITRRAGKNIQIVQAAAKSYNHDDLVGLDRVDVTDDAFAVVENPDIDIVVELIGGYSPARELVLKAIENGKHVVTANKALIALHGDEIFKAAESKGVMVAYEAAVAGGIPIIKAVREGLAANRIEWIAGIINGTGNFILSEMRDKGREFADVLAEAQALGYAEADPEFDVEGIDAAHKLTILASLAFGIPLQFDKACTEGITKILPEDVVFADQLGYRIKHLGVTRKTARGIEIRVHPALIPESRLLANVNGVMNAVVVQGDAVGQTLYYGAGAGSEPTASAVVADIIDVARSLETDADNRVPSLGFQPGDLQDTPVLPMDDIETSFYLRVTFSADEAEMASQVASILEESGVAFDTLQFEILDSTKHLLILTQTVQEKTVRAAINKLQSLDAVETDVIMIRVEGLEP